MSENAAHCCHVWPLIREQMEWIAHPCWPRREIEVTPCVRGPGTDRYCVRFCPACGTPLPRWTVKVDDTRPETMP